jgi:hypothetical protein
VIQELENEVIPEDDPLCHRLIRPKMFAGYSWSLRDIQRWYRKNPTNRTASAIHRSMYRRMVVVSS